MKNKGYLTEIEVPTIEIITNFFPASSGSSPSMRAASPTTPLPSTTAFSISISRNIASAIAFSLKICSDMLSKTKFHSAIKAILTIEFVIEVFLVLTAVYG